MAPSNSKANYKTYEAQARLVRAIVAAHPDVKWNYKEIVSCYGSDMSEHALNHRFRRVRAQVLIIQEGRKSGRDMKDLDVGEHLPTTKDAVETNNIAKYFGQSTGDGMQFQFRSIKKDAETLRMVEKNGGNVANSLSLGTGSGSAFSTPSKPTPVRGTGSRTGTARKRTFKAAIKRSASDEEEDDADDTIKDYSDMDDPETPSNRSKRQKAAGAVSGQKTGTPTRRAATKANATIAESFAQAQSGESAPESDSITFSNAATVQAAPQSIFGPVDQKPLIRNNGFATDYGNLAFAKSGGDAYFGAEMDDEESYYTRGNGYDVDDGEI